MDSPPGRPSALINAVMMFVAGLQQKSSGMHQIYAI
jgi:hypothetical protein